MHKHHCIFIHIPKNAGSSVLQAFNDKAGRKHAKWYEFFESNDYFFNRYFKFAIVREPLPRLYSAYSYVLKGGSGSADDIALQQFIIANSHDFESFIQHVLDADFIMLQLLFQPQYLYVFDRQLKSVTDSLLRYENLAHDWQNLAKRRGFVASLPKVNRSNIDKVLPELSESTQAKVELLYKMDYQLLGYTTKVNSR